MQDDEILGRAYDGRLMRRLLTYVRPYRTKVSIAIVLTVLIAALGPLRPYITKIAIDQYISTGDIAGLGWIAFLLLGTLVLQGVIQYHVTWFTQWIGQHTILDLRMQVFRKIHSLGLAYFDRNPVGRLVTRVTSDVEVLNEMFSSGIVNVFSDVFIIIWIMVFMFASDWQLSLMTLTVLPFLIYGTFLFRKRVRESYRQVRFEVARLNSVTQEMVSGMSTVQLFGREQHEYDRHRVINQAHTDANIRSVFYYAVFYPGVDFLSSITVGIIIWFAGGQILSGMMTIGTLIAFVQFTEMFFRPVRDLSEKYNILQSAMASSERIFQVLDDETRIPDPPGVHGSVPFGDIEFRNVTFAYDAPEWVLRDVSFTIPQGGTVAIVGATGSGKTTIISLLLRFYEQQQGDILMGGRSLRDIPAAELRRHISLVLQDVFLFSGTIRDNITLGRPDISDERVLEVCAHVGIDGFIASLPEGLDTPVKERGATLSSGQKQLLAFARALAVSPELLILDEATSNIDTETEQLIQSAITRILHDRTAIVIAHRLSTIQHADRILVMHKGRIRETGTHQELLALGGIYHKLYQLQYREQEGAT